MCIEEARRDGAKGIANEGSCGSGLMSLMVYISFMFEGRARRSGLSVA